MRRVVGMAVVLALAGCSALRDAFSAHVEVAGSAVGRAPRIPVRPDVISGVANVYLDYAVFATALGRGRDLRDSTLAAAAEWPLVAQLKWERYHERLLGSRGRLTPAEADSAYRAGTVRLFQHILIRVPQSAVPMVAEQEKKKADGVLAQAVAAHGANFASLAGRYSEDPGSKTRGGYLPATPRGQFVPTFDSAAWALAPGALSGVVRSPFGYHIIRRPPLAAARSDGHPLARSRGATFKVQDLARWLQVLDPNDVRGITAATNEQLTQFVKLLAQRDMLLGQVDSAGIVLTPADWRRVRAEHDSSVARLEGLLRVSPTLLQDSAATPDARVRLAMVHLDRYMDSAVTLGTAPFYPVP